VAILVGGALSLSAADAIDAHLLSGGLPGILRAWPDGQPALEFAERECADPASPLFGVPEAALLAEFPAPDVTRRVIEAVGGANRTQGNIAAEAGSRTRAVPSGTLTPILHRLVQDKHVLALDEPLSVRPTKPALYRVADSSLRFYLAMGRSAHELSRRGRAAPAAEMISRGWASWRGRAVEPMIQEALSLAVADLPWPEATAVGGWWNRRFDPEIDLVGADRTPVAGKLWYAGSIKWLDHPFGGSDPGCAATRCTADTRIRAGADRNDRRVSWRLHQLSSRRSGLALASRGCNQRLRIGGLTDDGAAA
jgi:hypothetical protein